MPKINFKYLEQQEANKLFDAVIKLKKERKTDKEVVEALDVTIYFIWKVVNHARNVLKLDIPNLKNDPQTFAKISKTMTKNNDFTINLYKHTKTKKKKSEDVLDQKPRQPSGYYLRLFEPAKRQKDEDMVEVTKHFKATKGHWFTEYQPTV